jgi:hypothetical protein
MDANASPKSTVCNDCSNFAAQQAAINETSNGDVYVFDGANKSVRKYNIFEEYVDTIPPQWVTTVTPLSVSTQLKNAFEDMVTESETIPSQITLPPDFPYATVVGGLDDTPATFQGHLSDYLTDNPLFSFAEAVRLFGIAAINNNVPVISVGELMAPPRIIVQFSDGSTIEVQIQYVNNITTDTLELTYTLLPETARDPNGDPIPSGQNPNGTWSGFNVSGSGPQLSDWVNWARNAGVPVTGWDGGPVTGSGSFTCTVSGSNISCTLEEDSE